MRAAGRVKDPARLMRPSGKIRSDGFRACMKRATLGLSAPVEEGETKEKQPSDIQ
jgi:hypothetical protein